MQWDYGKFILKQLDYSPSFSTSDSQLDCASLTIRSWKTRARSLIVKYSPIFKTARVAKKDLKDDKDNSRHLGRKYARIFVLGHYLFLLAHSLLLGTNNVRGQISEHIFTPNGGYCLCYPSNLFATRAVLKIGEYLTTIHRSGGG